MRIIVLCGFLALSAILTIGYRVVATIQDVSVAVAEFVMTPFRMDWGVARRMIERWTLTAFRVIGLLKPEYDASFDTDAQNFMSRVRFASHC